MEASGQLYALGKNPVPLNRRLVGPQSRSGRFPLMRGPDLYFVPNGILGVKRRNMKLVGRVARMGVVEKYPASLIL
jgi:hypothetical protein